jgi:hypothetical protein
MVCVRINKVHIKEPFCVQIFDVAYNFLAFYIVFVFFDESDIFILVAVLVQFFIVEGLSLLPLLPFDAVVDLGPDAEICNLGIKLSLNSAIIWVFVIPSIIGSQITLHYLQLNPLIHELHPFIDKLIISLFKDLILFPKIDRPLSSLNFLLIFSN